MNYSTLKELRLEVSESLTVKRFEDSVPVDTILVPQLFIKVDHSFIDGGSS